MGMIIKSQYVNAIYGRSFWSICLKFLSLLQCTVVILRVHITVNLLYSKSVQAIARLAKKLQDLQKNCKTRNALLLVYLHSTPNAPN